MRKAREPSPHRDRVNPAMPDHVPTSAPNRSTPVWQTDLADLVEVGPTSAIHLAVFVEPYLQYVLEGTKTLESRFSKNRCAPYERVDAGDLLLLKRSGGPVTGVCRVARVWFYELNPTCRKQIRAKFAKQLCAQDDDFWEARRDAVYATIMEVADVRSIDPVPCNKRDRRGWVILNDGRQPYLL